MKAMGRRSVSSFLTALLAIGWYGSLVPLALMVGLMVISPFVDVPTWKVTIPVSFTIDARTLRPATDTIEPSSAELVGAHGFGFEVGVDRDDAARAHHLHVRGALRVPASRTLIVGNALLFMVLLMLALWVLGQLRAVFRTLRDGQPFVPANARRLRWIGYGIIVGELARSAVAFFENYYAMTHFPMAGLRFDAWPDVSVLAIVHGLIILVIAEVFRAGTRLDEDQSLTV